MKSIFHQRAFVANKIIIFVRQDLNFNANALQQMTNAWNKICVYKEKLSTGILLSFSVSKAPQEIFPIPSVCTQLSLIHYIHLQ